MKKPPKAATAELKPSVAAPSVLPARRACASAAWSFGSATARSRSVRKMIGIMRNVEPFPMPAAMNSAMNASTKPSRLPPPPAVGRKNTATSGATAMTTNIQNVMIAPPTRSASQPPTGRARAASTGPMKANLNASTVGNSVLTSIGNPAAKPMNEPKVPMYSQLIPLLLVAEDRHLLGKAGAHGGDVVHAEPGGDHAQDDQRHPDETGVLYPDGHRRALV